MRTEETVPNDWTLSPEDWPREPERLYARLQAEFADECDLEVESRAVQTDDAGRVHSGGG